MDEPAPEESQGDTKKFHFEQPPAQFEDENMDEAQDEEDLAADYPEQSDEEYAEEGEEYYDEESQDYYPEEDQGYEEYTEAPQEPEAGKKKGFQLPKLPARAKKEKPQKPKKYYRQHCFRLSHNF